MSELRERTINSVPCSRVVTRGHGKRIAARSGAIASSELRERTINSVPCSRVVTRGHGKRIAARSGAIA